MIGLGRALIRILWASLKGCSRQFVDRDNPSMYRGRRYGSPGAQASYPKAAGGRTQGRTYTEREVDMSFASSSRSEAVEEARSRGLI
jgi:hypothetical protein